MGRTTKRERGRPRKQQSGASGPKRGPGRPPKIMPTPIPATLEELARAIMQGPPKKDLGLPQGEEVAVNRLYFGDWRQWVAFEGYLAVARSGVIRTLPSYG